MLAYSSPWLFAVNRVLLRLLMPRHSPYALISLIFLRIGSNNLSIAWVLFLINPLKLQQSDTYYPFAFIWFDVSFSPRIYSLCSFQGTLVGSSGFEPPTSRLSGVRSNQLSYEPIPGGDERVRTDGLLLARQALSQLSYTPVFGCDQLSRSTLQQSEDVLTPSKPYSAFDAS